MFKLLYISVNLTNDDLMRQKVDTKQKAELFEEPKEWTYDYQYYENKPVDTGMHSTLPMNGGRKKARIDPEWQMSVIKNAGSLYAKFYVSRYDTLLAVRQKLKDWGMENPGQINDLELYKDNVRLEYSDNRKTVEGLGLAPKNRITNFFDTTRP
jgi:hypothetical protein